MVEHQCYSLCTKNIFFNHFLYRNLYLVLQAKRISWKCNYKGTGDFRINSQLESLSFHGKVRSKARICLRFFQVLFFLPAAAPPIPECYQHLRREIATQHLE